MRKFLSICLLGLASAATGRDLLPMPARIEWRDGEYKGVFAPYATVDKNAGIPPEGYILSVDSARIEITAGDNRGLDYGLQTLAQLRDPRTGAIPCVRIVDSPRFAYRGMMLDVSRHFRSVDFIKKQIDAMAALKLNVLHLHLTDAAGWRLQIDRYPRLTSMAAWRPKETWKEWIADGSRYATEGAPDAHGGYYTKDEIRDIVDYARERHITVIPEIELPSHSEEVLAAYPELSCTHEPTGQSDFCPGNEATFEFLQNVLDEVMEIFPSHVIHIGGDEAPKTAWKTCPLCQKRMADEGLTDLNDLQRYMINRIGRYLASKGRRMMGWDEIMDGGKGPEGAAVMVWRDASVAIPAMEAGHEVVMTPGKYCYLDAYQDAPASQPEAIGGYLPLEKVYSFNPPAGVKGIQGNLFTEYIPTDAHAEYMLYPRMFAIAERAWSPDSVTDYASFRQRALALGEQMSGKGYNVFPLASEIGDRPESLAPVRHAALGAKVEFVTPWWERYPANGDSTLTDGIRGSWTYSDARWLAFVNRMDVILDLGEIKEAGSVHGLHADFMQICGPGVWFPEKVTLQLSTDGVKWSEPKTLTLPTIRTDKPGFHTFAFPINEPVRYARLAAEASEANGGGILFVDEIVVSE